MIHKFKLKVPDEIIYALKKYLKKGGKISRKKKLQD